MTDQISRRREMMRQSLAEDLSFNDSDSPRLEELLAIQRWVNCEIAKIASRNAFVPARRSYPHHHRQSHRSEHRTPRGARPATPHSSEHRPGSYDNSRIAIVQPEQGPFTSPAPSSPSYSVDIARQLF
jgi:hypothetical protein